MNVNKETLSINYKITNLSISYEMGKVSWADEDSEISIEEDDEIQVGYLTIWKKNVKPESIKDDLLLLKKRIDDFVLAMKFRGDRQLICNQTSTIYYINDNEEFYICNEKDDIEAIIRRLKGEKYTYLSGVLPPLEGRIELNASPVCLPRKMPRVSNKLRRYILTVIQAEELDKYPDYQDEQLKRWFLILEGLVDKDEQKEEKYRHMKYMRDFVSHPICDRCCVIKFIKEQLPTAVFEKEMVRFDRDDIDHTSLVAKYEGIARKWARNLVEQKIKKDGGYI